VVGPSGLRSGSQQAFSSAASSPAPGSIASPLPVRAIVADDFDSNPDVAKAMASGLARKRAREDDDFADEDEAEETEMAASGQATNGGPAKSGIVVQVNGVSMDFSEVTDDHHDLMTPEEYEAYFEVASSMG